MSMISDVRRDKAEGFGRDLLQSQSLAGLRIDSLENMVKNRFPLWRWFAIAAIDDDLAHLRQSSADD